MGSKNVTSRSVPSDQVGSHWEPPSRSTPGALQTSFNWDAKARLESAQAALREAFVRAVRAAGDGGGTVDWLTTALNRSPEYASKISEAVRGHGERKVQLEWIVPLLFDVDSAEELLGVMCELAGFEPPVRKRPEPPVEDVNRAAREVLSELKDDEQRELMRARIAKRLGVKPADVRL
jgi:hypothetical protein